ncbi:hypothetical protein C8J38_11030 [Rhizobium sp. PP-WC-2G-219]|nr:hypothetical protein C8J38_11030 [Rhizobium sp. PP-WC-2G-219]
MPVLQNTRHEAFAQVLAKGMTATDAYTEAGYKGDRLHRFELSTTLTLGGAKCRMRARAYAMPC